MNCPCCGHPVDSVPTSMLEEVRLPKQESVIMHELARAFPRRVSIDALIDALYYDDPNGGPDDPQGVIRVRISHIRKAIRAYGWTIPSNQTGPGAHSRYRLERIEGKAG